MVPPVARAVTRAVAGHSFFRFCLVGGVGFLVDAGVLMALLALEALGPVSARIVSILVALTATWILNRLLTFRSEDPRYLFEWSRYALVNGVGALVNYGCYIACLLLIPGIAPLLALAIGSAVALIVNYLGSRHLVFWQGSASRS